MDPNLSMIESIETRCPNCDSIEHHNIWRAFDFAAERTESTRLQDLYEAKCFTCGMSHSYAHIFILFNYFEDAPMITIMPTTEDEELQDALSAELDLVMQNIVGMARQREAPLPLPPPIFVGDKFIGEILSWDPNSNRSRNTTFNESEAPGYVRFSIQVAERRQQLAARAGVGFLLEAAANGRGELTPLVEESELPWSDDAFISSVIEEASSLSTSMPQRSLLAFIDVIRATANRQSIESAWSNFIKTHAEEISSTDIGQLYREAINPDGEYSDRLEKAHRGLHLAKLLSDNRGIGQFCHAITLILLPSNRTDQSTIAEVEHYLTMGIPSSMAAEDWLTAAVMKNNLANILVELASVSTKEGALERGIVLLKEALNHFELLGDARSIAHVQSDLSLLLVKLADYQDQQSLLQAALHYSNEAIKYRLIDGTEADKAYSLSHRASVKRALATNEESDDSIELLIEAVKDQEAALSFAMQTADEYLVVQLYSDLSELSERIYGLASTDNQGYLERSVEAARAAVARSLDRHTKGIAFLRLSKALHYSQSNEERRTCLERACSLIDGNKSPDRKMEAEFVLGDLLADIGEWGQAADNFLNAMESNSDAAMHSLDTNPTFARSARWAAFCAARSGRLVQAVEVLEAGRCQISGVSFRREKEDLNIVRSFRPELASKYEEIKSAVMAAGHLENKKNFGRLNQCIDEIRQAGFPRFRRLRRLSEFAQKATAENPLVYLVSSPWGSASLIVENDFAPGVDVIWSDLRSNDIAHFLLGSPTPLLSRPTPNDVRKSLDLLLPAIGEKLMKELTKRLVSSEAKTVTLVASGLLSFVPLHAAWWPRQGESRCLWDEMVVRYLPAAAFAEVRDESWEAGERKLIALGNPSTVGPNLQGAQSEVVKAVHSYQGNAHAVFGSAATIAFLHQALKEPCDLHIACHASSAISQQGGPQLHLADGVINESDLRKLGHGKPLGTVFLAACMTGDIDLTSSPDEATGLTTAFLELGATGVITSLWPLNDDATGLLSAYYYEYSQLLGQTPAEALRNAAYQLRRSNRKKQSRLAAAISPWFRKPQGREIYPYENAYYWAGLTFNGSMPSDAIS